MKISIITPTFNSVKTISDTIESIVTQTHQDIEYIIIDGGSTDGTLAIIEDYIKKFNIQFISEPDQGLYDAMNKGIRLATGEIVGILNSDDFYKDEKVLEKVVACFNNDPKIDGCYGDLEFVDEQDKSKIVRTWRSGKYREGKLNNGWIIPHPTFFVKNEIYKKFGDFNLSFKIAADYEFLLRMLKIKRINVGYIPEILVCMRTGGKSGKNLTQRKLGWQELKRAWTVNNLKVPRLFILRRVLFKIGQYL